MSEPCENGTLQEIDGVTRICYDGYWIKYYEPPAESIEAKKLLIHALTRRLFNHVEHGINIPGIRLKEARRCYQRETDPERKRVNGAMLAGALFNRAADIFTKVVELQEVGVEIAPEDALMRECGECLLEALDLGKLVRHRGGAEGIDELWGEPFKAFSQSIATFYDSRYLKIALTMRDIDRVTQALVDTFAGSNQLPDIEPRIREFCTAAKSKCEILRTDPAVFDVWPTFVVCRERLRNTRPILPPAPTAAQIREAQESYRVLAEGNALVTHIVRARVPMPKSTMELLDKCTQFRRTFLEPRDTGCYSSTRKCRLP